MVNQVLKSKNRAGGLVRVVRKVSKIWDPDVPMPSLVLPRMRYSWFLAVLPIE